MTPRVHTNAVWALGALGHLQGHLLSASLASVAGQCPVHGSSLKGTGHFENQFVKLLPRAGQHWD